MAQSIQLCLPLYRRQDDHYYAQMDVELSEDGKIVFSGVKGGEVVERVYGDSDYEYWLKLPAAIKGQLQRILVMDRFGQISSKLLKEWVNNVIPAAVIANAQASVDDVILLYLLQERFRGCDDIHKIIDWCKVNDIEAKYEYWI